MKTITESTCPWKQNKTHLNNPRGKMKVSREIKKYTEINENATYQNLWDTTKAVLGGGVPVLLIPQYFACSFNKT